MQHRGKPQYISIRENCHNDKRGFRILPRYCLRILPLYPY